MPSPFPGMNPYLENPELWPQVHTRLIVAIADFLVPQISPKYIVAIEERIYQTYGDDSLLVGIPDVVVQRPLTSTNQRNSNVAVVTPVQATTVTIPIPEIVKERYLEVRRTGTREVVTDIEILSPKNKRLGEGRKAYLDKRERILGISTHLVEIDLLRAGEAMPILENGFESDYRILISRSDHRPQADLYAFNLNNIIPTFSLPLRTEDTEPVLDLHTLINELYARAAYDLVIDYNLEPVPPLSETNAAWANAWLK